ncbi:MAG: ABC transporter ATP-binding protein [Alphaproteobacteria bacterium]|nr:ABC transporter ATP-binding protein [Alphaproteobacteria bacterium]MCB9690893.1 ABC transporter ATP-binding protein [Alphaproteobacteria bacterium]
MQHALRFVDVVKTYGGKRALDGLTFDVPTGGITGFVGPNGAGKTTTFSVVSGFLTQDEGALEILGLPAFDPWKHRGRLGVLPQDAELSDRHTPLELLTHLARLQGMGGRDAAREASRVVDVVRLSERGSSRIASLSHGMRRRVAVASALLGSPELVLLDEPMAGLDPLQAKSLREALAELRGRQTLVVSSHNLDELERFCDHVVMIDQGRCLRQGPIGAVTGQQELVQWWLAGPPPLDALAAALPDHSFTFADGVLAQRAPSGADLDAASLVLMGALVSAGVAVRAVRRGKGLEHQFLEDAAR